MTAIVTGLVLLAGPFVVLGLWLWLRSRRAPVHLAEPLDLGRVMGDVFGVFRRGNWPVSGLALLLVGLPTLVWQVAFQPAMQTQIATQNRLLAQARLAPALRPNPFAVFAGSFSTDMVVALVVKFVLGTLFYVAATLFLVRSFERRPIALVDALKASPVLVLPALIAALLAYLGIVAGMMLFVLPGILLALSWFVVVPVLVAERTGMVRCFGRSRALAIGSRGRIFVLALLMMVVAFVLTAPTGAMTGLFGGAAGQAPSAAAIAIQLVVGTIGASIYAAFPAALYVELKRIREGLAMPELAEVFA